MISDCWNDACFPCLLLLVLSHLALLPFSFLLCRLHVPGKHDSSPDGSGGVCRVHLQGFWKQCSGCVPHHHLGVSATAAQAAAKTQQFPQRPETSLATAPSTSARSDWANGPGPGHEEGPGQELCAHVETYHYKYIYMYKHRNIYKRESLFIIWCFFFSYFPFLHCRGVRKKKHCTVETNALDFFPFCCVCAYFISCLHICLVLKWWQIGLSLWTWGSCDSGSAV